MRAISRAIRRSNFTLLKLEVYSNFLTQHDGSSMTEEDEGAGNTSIWQDCERDLKSSLLRNELLKRRTADAALALLPYARVLLFRSPRPKQPSNEKQVQIRSASGPLPTPSPFHFRSLPLEIQHQILSFLAPILSPSQQIRIFNHAASPSTLRPVLPKLSHSGGCIPDPSSLPFGIPRPMRACASGRCMGSGGSLVCHRIEERMRWLQEVGCSRFDMVEGTDVDALLSLWVLIHCPQFVSTSVLLLVLVLHIAIREVLRPYCIDMYNRICIASYFWIIPHYVYSDISFLLYLIQYLCESIQNRRKLASSLCLSLQIDRGSATIKPMQHTP